METVEICLYRSCRRSCLDLCGGTQQTERDSALARHLVSCHARQTPKSTELTVASKKMAGLRVQIPPQVYKRAEKTRGFNSLDESGRRERLVWYLT